MADMSACVWAGLEPVGVTFCTGCRWRRPSRSTGLWRARILHMCVHCWRSFRHPPRLVRLGWRRTASSATNNAKTPLAKTQQGSSGGLVNDLHANF